MPEFTSRPVVAEDAPFVVAVNNLPHVRDFVVAPTEDQVRAARSSDAIQHVWGETLPRR